jgi:hypothetical protein
MHYAVHQNCGRPFCKLKKKDHYHCIECNQAFSDPARLRCHIGKHGIKFKRSESAMRVLKPSTPVTIAPRPIAPAPESTGNASGEIPAGEIPDVQGESGEDELDASSSLNLNPSTFSNMIAKAQEQNRVPEDIDNTDGDGDLLQSSRGGYSTEQNNLSGTDQEESQTASADEEMLGFTGSEDNLSESRDGADPGNLSRRSGRKRTATKHDDFVDTNAVVVKQRRTSVTTSPRGGAGGGSSPRGGGGGGGVKDDSVPLGYVRFRYNEDCQHTKCAYRQTVTHYHCERADCGYGFSDRSRLVQHTLRHDRIDGLTGGEMQQYRINQDCYRDDCEFKCKSSHFHCLKCDYRCTDSGKVLTHRKYHAKLESISSQGFEKFMCSEECNIADCVHSKRQTHYHCTDNACQFAVVSPAQMSPHKMKHITDGR